MFKINLVPEVQENKLKEKRNTYYATLFGISLVGLCVVFILLVTGVQLVKASQLSSTKKKITDINTELEEYKDLEETVLSLEKGLTGIKEIANGSNQWTKLLTHLEKATPTDVKFTKMKLTGETAEATLSGSSVNSLAKFVESLKLYQVIALSGNGVEGETYNVSIDGGASDTVQVKTTGKWNLAVNFDPTKDHEIKVEGEGKTVTIKFVAEKKKLESSDSITASVEKLFSQVEATKYNKDKETTIETKFNFNSKILW